MPLFRRPIDRSKIVKQITRSPNHSSLFFAGALAALCAQRVEAQLAYTTISYSETASATATDATPSTQTLGDSYVLTYSGTASAVTGSTPGSEYLTSVKISAGQVDTLNAYTIETAGGIASSTEFPDETPATATATGTTSFSATFQVSAPQEFLLSGSLGAAQGTDSVSFSESRDTLYQVSSSPSSSGPGSALVSYSLSLTPGESYTLTAKGSVTTGPAAEPMEVFNNYWDIVATVPEPTTSVIMLVGAWGVMRRRRRGKVDVATVIA